jgi:hypothetical protein
MSTAVLTFDAWLDAAQLKVRLLTAAQLAVLRSAFDFLQSQGSDYYSRRLLSHFLLHSGLGLKVAQTARLVGFSRSAASRQQDLSSKEVVQAVHHRLAGRPHGKLLPRYAGPVAQFLAEHPDATHYDTRDFIARTWKVGVSLVALHFFLKKYGLDVASRRAPATPPVAPADASPAPESATVTIPNPTPTPVAAAGQAVPVPAQHFFLHPPTTPGPSC